MKTNEASNSGYYTGVVHGCKRKTMLAVGGLFPRYAFGYHHGRTRLDSHGHTCRCIIKVQQRRSPVEEGCRGSLLSLLVESKPKRMHRGGNAIAASRVKRHMVVGSCCDDGGKTMNLRPLHEVEMTHHKGTSIPFRALSQACALLSTVFGHHDDERRSTSMQFSNYTLRLMAALQSRAIMETSDFVLFMSHQASTGSLAGVVTISKGLNASGASSWESLTMEQGYVPYSLCNMAVKASCRRQGVATQMLAYVEEYLQDIRQQQDGLTVLVLSVDSYNIEAQRLYKRLGYQMDTSWVDPRWIEAVDRDRIDVPRRLLMFKPLEPHACM